MKHIVTNQWIVLPVVLLVLSLALAGCNSGTHHDSQSNSQSNTVTPGTTNPPQPAIGPQITGATLEDVDGSETVSKGDIIHVTFSGDVQVVGQKGLDPNKEFSRPVKDDSFGTNATLTQNGKKNRLMVVLGSDPRIRVCGTFSSQKTGLGAPTGFDVLSTGNVVGANGASVSPSKPVDLAGPFKEGFTVTGRLQVPRGLHTATVLSDGRVLVAGGVTSGPNNKFIAQSEIYDPTTGTFMLANSKSLGGSRGGYMWDAKGKFPAVRMLHTATRLQDGRVLVCGGYGIERQERYLIFFKRYVREELRGAYLFNPRTNTFKRTRGSMLFGRSRHQATLLKDGRVLVTGGYNKYLNRGRGGTLPTAEIFDPRTETFFQVNGKYDRDLCSPRMDFAATAVNGGTDVLLVGGTNYTGGRRVYMADIRAELYDKGSFQPTRDFPTARRFASATELPDGKVLVAGGDSDTSSGPIGTAEVYDVKTRRFTKVAGNMKRARTFHAASSVGGPVGDVLLVGGCTLSNSRGTNETDSAEIFSADSGSFESEYKLTTPRNGCTATMLADGRVLVVGGFQNGTGVLSLSGRAVPHGEIFSRE
jgi:hypothetical protein